ncbi:MAG: VTT domain-containing protein [Gallionellaceae bacterium]|nr:VTT domain-containing protein [Gallionellaceae bacterium]
MVEHFLGVIQPILAHYPLAAPIVFIGVHTLMAVFFLPCSPMTLMAGALWGGMYGLVVSVVAAIVSSATTFCLSRSFLHSKIERFLMHRYPKVAGLLLQASAHDWKLIAVSQMNPLIPSSTMGYIFGLSRVTLGRYLLFSIVFMLPLQVLFVMTGHSVAGLLTSDTPWGVTLMLVFVVVVFSFFGKRGYKKLCLLLGVKNGT